MKRSLDVIKFANMGSEAVVVGTGIPRLSGLSSSTSGIRPFFCIHNHQPLKVKLLPAISFLDLGIDLGASMDLE